MKSKLPYIETTRVVVNKAYNPDYGDDRICKCGHPYYRHFDGYDNNKAVGCKYCDCFEFKLPKDKINYIVKAGRRTFECETEAEAWDACGHDWTHEVSSPTGKSVQQFIPF